MRGKNMGTEFFDELGETITKTAKGLGERAEMLYEAQKLRNKISSEDRMIDKTMADLGNILYKRYLKGEVLGAKEMELCAQIDRHREEMWKYKDSLANMKGKKLCPACEKAVDKDAAFCSYCGAACPTPEPEEEADNDAVEVPEEAFEEESAPEQVVEETEAEESPVGESETEVPQADAAEEAPSAEATTEEAPTEEEPIEEKE